MASQTRLNQWLVRTSRKSIGLNKGQQFLEHFADQIILRQAAKKPKTLSLAK
jgi:hypothetical protein